MRSSEHSSQSAYKRRTFPIIICAKWCVSYDTVKLNVAPEQRPLLHYTDVEA